MSARFRIASAIAAVTAAATLAGIAPAASATPQSALEMRTRSASTIEAPALQSAGEMKTRSGGTSPVVPDAFSNGGDTRQASTKTECTYEGGGWYDCTDFECNSSGGVTVCTSTEMYYKKAGNTTHFPHD